MLRYTWKRILTGILSLFVLVTVTFFLVRLIPGSPFRQGGVSEQVVETIEQEYGLNEPVLTQYFSYIGNVLRGDLGVSYQDPATRVTEIIARAWPGPSGNRTGDLKSSHEETFCKRIDFGRRDAGSGNTRFCGCDPPAFSIQCKIKMAAGIRTFKSCSLYSAGHGSVSIPCGDDRKTGGEYT